MKMHNPNIPAKAFIGKSHLGNYSDSMLELDGETYAGARADIGDDPENPDLHIVWKYLYTAKDTWLGPQQNLGAISHARCRRIGFSQRRSNQFQPSQPKITCGAHPQDLRTATAQDSFRYADCHTDLRRMPWSFWMRHQ